jgi:hypothetical protein
MLNKTGLMQSVSAVATASAAAAVGGTAYAQGPMPMPNVVGYTYSAQGGLFFGPAPTSATFDDKLGSLDDFFGPDAVVSQGFSHDLGATAGATFGVKFDNDWDATFGFAVHEFMKNSASASATSGSSFTFSGGSAGGGVFASFNETKTFGFETTDFEVGFTPKLDNGMNVRLFGGVRALHFHSTDTTTSASGFNQFSSFFSSGSSFSSFGSNLDAFTSNFFGMGPRAGVSGSTRFEGSPFGISGQISGAVIVGQQTDTHQHSFTSGFSGFFNGSSFGNSSTSSGPVETNSYIKTVLDLEAEAGLDYYLNDTTKLTVGVQVETLSNVGVGANSGVNQSAAGTFVKVSGTF